MAKKKTRGRRSSGIRERILNVAEKHFAGVGYSGTSLRTIAADADVQLSHIYYYFKSKAHLYDEVFQRHTDMINSRRREALKEISPADTDIETLVRDLINPWVEYTTSGRPSARRYAQMVARLVNNTDKASAELIRKHFDPIATEFIEAFGRALPEVDRRTLAWGYVLSIGTVLGALANAGRVDRLDHSKRGSRESSELEEMLVRFLVGGWEASTRQAGNRRRDGS